MAESQVSVGGAIRYGWSLLTSSWRAVWGALALNALAATVWAAGLAADQPALLIGGYPALLVTSLMVNGALLRIGLADRHPGDTEFKPGHHGLQWGRLEWRLLGAAVLVAVFLLVIACLLLIAMGAVLMGLDWAGVLSLPEGQTLQAALNPKDNRYDPIVLAPLAVLIAIIAYLRARLALAFPATADDKAVRVLRTWRLTRGHVWPIIASVLFVLLPAGLLSAWVQINLLNPNGLAVDAGPTALLIASIVQGVTDGLFVTPMIAGVCIYFHRALRDASPAPAPRP